MKTTIEMAREAGFNVKMFKPPVITAQHINGSWVSVGDELKAFEALVRADERAACAYKTGEFAQKWWSIYCASNKHMETTRKAHDDFCALQAAIRARGNT